MQQTINIISYSTIQLITHPAICSWLPPTMLSLVAVLPTTYIIHLFLNHLTCLLRHRQINKTLTTITICEVFLNLLQTSSKATVIISSRIQVDRTNSLRVVQINKLITIYNQLHRETIITKQTLIILNNLHMVSLLSSMPVNHSWSPM